MIEREFEEYLALLRGLLRLRKRQCDAIADELRDHMDARLEDLLAEGIPRQKAVQIALEEFGDAAGVGQAFLEVNRNNQRRWNMRITAASLLTCTAVGLGLMAFWPQAAQHTENRVLAQAGAGAPSSPSGAGGAPAEVRSKEENNAITAQKLTKIQQEVEFNSLPLMEFAQQIAELCNVNVIVDKTSLENAEIDANVPITITLRDVRLDTALEMALKQVGDAGYYIHDGIVIITSKDVLVGVTEVRVYNVADLVYLETAWPLDPARGGGGRPGMMGGASGMGMGSMPGMPPGMGSGGMGSPGGMPGPGGYGGGGAPGYGGPGGLGGTAPGSPGSGGPIGPGPAGGPRGGAPGVGRGGPGGYGGSGAAGGEGGAGNPLGSPGGIPGGGGFPGGPGAGSFAPGAGEGGGSPYGSASPGGVEGSGAPTGGAGEGSPSSGAAAPSEEPGSSVGSLEKFIPGDDILAQMGMGPGGGGRPGGMGGPPGGIGGGPPGGMMGGMGGMEGMGGGGLGGGARPQYFSKDPSAYTPEERRTVDLIQAIRSAVETGSWAPGDGVGEIRPFEGLLIIRNTPKAHEGVEALLQQIRAARHLHGGGGGMGAGMGMF